MQNKFSVKVGILSQGGGGVWPNPNFYKALFLWHIWPFFAENFRKIHGKSQRSGRGGEVKPVGPNSQLLLKICFASSPIMQDTQWVLLMPVSQNITKIGCSHLIHPVCLVHVQYEGPICSQTFLFVETRCKYYHQKSRTAPSPRPIGAPWLLQHHVWVQEKDLNFKNELKLQSW